MSNSKNRSHTHLPPSPPDLHTLLGVSLAPPVLPNPPFPTCASLSLLTTKSKSKLAPDPDSSIAVAASHTVNIATLNVTYGDHFEGAIHNGCVGGRRNEYYSELRSCTPAPPSPPPSPLLFTVEGETLVFGIAGAFCVAGIAAVLMLLRR
ncbi:hypothetical protein PLEOSDRAFT_160328 [Pleurotus ostreatus PC15]|uniref:Uncharacterized protein n=1 Tax=Pleurotus ostreatus (strain PC15) TaxID=1137138 RepID=A0A067NQ14_PLEO1|nr:hypothetical protein PLEOSDRAFT_160328 [Pleurotus ostreatus PC15]